MWVADQRYPVSLRHLVVYVCIRQQGKQSQRRLAQTQLPVFLFWAVDRVGLCTPNRWWGVWQAPQNRQALTDLSCTSHQSALTLL